MSAVTRRVVIAVSAVVLVVAVGAGLLAGAGDGLSSSALALLLSVVVAGIVILVVVVVRPWAPVTEPADQPAVARALTEGGTTDPRIDALARRAAEHESRRIWFIWLAGFSVVLQLAAAVVRVIEDDSWFQVGLAAVLAFSFAGTGWSAVQSRRRALRYLARDYRPT